MRLLPICYFALLTACAPNTAAIRAVVPDIPHDLRTPCPAPALTGLRTNGDISDLLLGYDAALTCANGKIEATDHLLTIAEGRPQ